MILRLLKRITQSPAVNLVVGLIFLATGIIELWKSSGEILGVHHGVILFSIVHVLKAVVEIYVGLEHAERG